MHRGNDTFSVDSLRTVGPTNHSNNMILVPEIVDAIRNELRHRTHIAIVRS